jgi:hypothetical protein
VVARFIRDRKIETGFLGVGAFHKPLWFQGLRGLYRIDRVFEKVLKTPFPDFVVTR